MPRLSAVGYALGGMDLPVTTTRLASMRLWAGLVALLCAGCGGSGVPSPFDSADAGVDSDAATPADAEQPEAGDAAAEGGLDEPGLGGPCEDDEECADQLDCTFDFCDLEVGRCRFDPDHSQCADGVYCNGVELCDPRLGCVPGEIIACSDGTACTIDRCDEANRTCEHVPRDADGDGDPVAACGNGADCDDTDPHTSSLAIEVCSSGRDEDCDGSTDEADCVLPEYDVCADPLEVTGSGSYALLLAGAQGDYAASCAGSGAEWQDVVVAIVVDDGPVDVDLVVTAATGAVAIARVELCGDPSSELACAEGVEPPGGGTVARVRLRGLESGAHAIYVFGSSVAEATLAVDFQSPTPPPSHETCGTAVPVTPGEHVLVELVGVELDVASACESTAGELVYSLGMAATQDLRAYATSTDGYGEPVLSLRNEHCSDAQDELGCRRGEPAELFARALPAGTYHLAVAATGPTDVDLVVELTPPSEAPADEVCAGAPLLPSNTTVNVPLAGHVDDLDTGCLDGAVDAVYRLDLDERSDVRIIQRISAGDQGAVSLATPPCDPQPEVVSCETGGRSPVRTAARGLEPGSVLVVSESEQANPTQLTALVRTASPPVLVAFADDCDQAVEIPSTGGFFQGNTSNATADYEAGCDVGGRDTDGARDQMLRLELETTRRVVFDMQGSGYRTLLSVRRGPECPGLEVVDGCAAGYVAGRSFLDLVLQPGEYFVQVDGYSGDSGPWFLDVFVLEP